MRKNRMHKKGIAVAAASLGMAIAVMAPLAASAADNGESDITRTGCHYSSYIRNTQMVSGQWPVSIWDSAGCKSTWVSFTLNNNANPIWRPANAVQVFMLRSSGWGTAIDGRRYYNWTGPGHYFSSMTRNPIGVWGGCGYLFYNNNKQWDSNCNISVR
jgi:hypothetical protein